MSYKKEWFLEQRLLTFLTSLCISEQEEIYLISKEVEGGSGYGEMNEEHLSSRESGNIMRVS